MLPPARRAFLARLIDYAGLFPPAELALEPALDLYGRYRTGADADLLGRFLIPAARLDAADPLVEAVAGEAPIVLLRLGRSAPRVARSGGLRTGARRRLGMARRGRSARRAGADVRARARRPRRRATPSRRACPHRSPATPTPSRARSAASRRTSTGRRARRRVAVEIPFLSDPDATEPACAAVADANGRLGRDAYAVKFRCGGEGVPASRRLPTRSRPRAGPASPSRPRPVSTTRSATRPRPAPTRTASSTSSAARSSRPSTASPRATWPRSSTAATRPRGPLGDTLAWTSLAARPDQVHDARSAVALAYGSCSFDEPREDLRALGWL